MLLTAEILIRLIRMISMWSALEMSKNAVPRLSTVACACVLFLCWGCVATRPGEGKWTLVFEPGGQQFAGTMSWTKPWQNLVSSSIASNQAAKLALFGNNGRKIEERIYRNRLIVQIRKWNESSDLVYESEMVGMGGTNCWRNLEFWRNGRPRMEVFAVEQSNTVIRIGTGKSWYSSGQQESEYTFDNSQLNGPMKSWDKTGRLVAEGEMRNHKPWQGTFARWGLPDEGPRKILTYKEGKKVGETAPPVAATTK